MGAPYRDETVRKKKRLVRKLKKAAKSAGYTYTDVAKELGVGANTARHWFDEKQFPYEATLCDNIEALIACYTEEAKPGPRVTCEGMTGEEPVSFLPTGDEAEVAQADVVKAILKFATSNQLLAELTRRA